MEPVTETAEWLDYFELIINRVDLPVAYMRLEYYIKIKGGNKISSPEQMYIFEKKRVVFPLISLKFKDYFFPTGRKKIQTSFFEIQRLILN